MSLCVLRVFVVLKKPPKYILTENNTFKKEISLTFIDQIPDYETYNYTQSGFYFPRFQHRRKKRK